MISPETGQASPSAYAAALLAMSLALNGYFLKQIADRLNKMETQTDDHEVRVAVLESRAGMPHPLRRKSDLTEV